MADVSANNVGLIVTDDLTEIANPLVGKTFAFLTTTNSLYRCIGVGPTVWESAVWGTISSGGLTLKQHIAVTSNSTTKTFTSLDGNTEGVYVLNYKIKNKNGSASNYVLNPNAGTPGGHISTKLYAAPGGIAGVNSSGTLDVGFCANDTWLSGCIEIHARKTQNSITQPMTYHGNFSNYDSGIGFIYTAMVSGQWTDFSTNLTSLDFNAVLSNGIGDGSELWLYTKAQ